MRLCLRSQALHTFSVALIAENKKMVQRVNHTETRPEAFFQLLADDLKIWGVPWSALTSIAVVNGPGSYTSLRTLTTLANTLAFALKIPVVGLEQPEKHTDKQVFLSLGTAEHARPSWVVPAYAHAPHITKPKKSSILK